MSLHSKRHLANIALILLTGNSFYACSGNNSLLNANLAVPHDASEISAPSPGPSDVTSTLPSPENSTPAATESASPVASPVTSPVTSTSTTPAESVARFEDISGTYQASNGDQSITLSLNNKGVITVEKNCNLSNYSLNLKSAQIKMDLPYMEENSKLRVYMAKSKMAASCSLTFNEQSIDIAEVRKSNQVVVTLGKESVTFKKVLSN